MPYQVIRTVQRDDGSATVENVGVAYEWRDDALNYIQARRTQERGVTGIKYTVTRVWNADEFEAAQRNAERYRNNHVRHTSGQYDVVPPSILALLPKLQYPFLAFESGEEAAPYIYCYLNDQDMMDERITRLRLGRALTQYAGVSSHEAHHLVQQALTERLESDFEITGDQTIIREAFIGTAMRSESSSHESCMRHSFDVPPEYHPCNGYGGESPLKLAVMRRRSDRMLVARSVVWPDREGFVRVYGLHETMRSAMTRWLVEKSSMARLTGFAQARINLITHPTRPYTLIVPYVDGNTRTCDAQGVLMHGNGMIPVQNAACLFEQPRRATVLCDSCGERVDENRVIRVIREVSGRREHVCRQCANTASTTLCAYYGEMVEGIGVPVAVSMEGGRLRTARWSNRAVSRFAFYCRVTEQTYSRNGFTEVSVRMPNGETVSGCFEMLRLRYNQESRVHTINMGSPHMRQLMARGSWMATQALSVFDVEGETV